MNLLRCKKKVLAFRPHDIDVTILFHRTIWYKRTALPTDMEYSCRIDAISLKQKSSSFAEKRKAK